MEKTRPFEQLSEADQKAAIDVMVSLAVLTTRIPSVGKPLTDYLTTEFASCYQLPKNVVKYALTDIGRALFNQEWEFKATKADQQFWTQFIPKVESGGNNGEGLVQKSETNDPGGGTPD